MKKLLLFVFIVQTLSADAQIVGILSNVIPAGAKAIKKHRHASIEKLKYTIDTIRYRNEVILMQRYNPNQLQEAMGQSAARNNVLSSLTMLQSELDRLNMWFREFKPMGGAQLDEPYFLKKIKDQKTDFDYSNYEKEYELYHRVWEEQNALERAAHAEKIAAIEASRRENDERAAEIARRKRLIAEEERLDGISRQKVEDSLRMIAERKEAKAEAAKEKKHRIAVQEKKEKRKSDLISKYGAEKGGTVAEGKVSIGMTKEMCIDAWGKPNSINTTTTANGSREQWVYSLKSYLYFDGTLLTAIQN